MNPPLGTEEFWRECRAAVPGLPGTVPEAWAFGTTSAHADSLLALVLDGTKTATASSFWDYEHSQDPLPEAGLLNTILNGRGEPCALVQIIAVEIVPFDDVPASHAFAEGEGGRSLPDWRTTHERYWRAHSENPRGFEPGMPVVCERIRLMYAKEWVR